MPLNWTLLKMVEVVKFMLCVFYHHKKRKKYHLLLVATLFFILPWIKFKKKDSRGSDLTHCSFARGANEQWKGERPAAVRERGETRERFNQFLVNESTSTRGLLLVSTFLSCRLLISLDHISYPCAVAPQWYTSKAYFFHTLQINMWPTLMNESCVWKIMCTLPTSKKEFDVMEGLTERCLYQELPMPFQIPSAYHGGLLWLSASLELGQPRGAGK